MSSFENIFAAISAVRGKNDISGEVSGAFPISEEASLAEEQRLKAFKILEDAKPGQMIEGEGVFIGLWQFKNRSGKSIAKTFAVFAAPEDLPDEAGQRSLFTYVEAVQRVAGLENWHGFNGMQCKNDTDFYRNLEGGSYHGEWVIPPFEVLSGRDVDGNRVNGTTLYACQAMAHSVLSDTFNQSADNLQDKDFPMWYWSCSEPRDKIFDVLLSVKFTHLDECLFHKKSFQLSCRPIRLKEILS